MDIKMDSAETPLPLRIDIVSDVVCPWCIIGYKQLQLALEQREGLFDVSIFWQPFELNPNMPPQGQELREHIAQKYGASAAQSGGVRARMQELADKLGFSFNFYEGMRIYNTFQAHQLLHWALSKHKQTELKLALFEAYFSKQEDVSDEQVLVAAAAHVGLDAAQAADVLASSRYAEAVRSDQALWLDKDVHAVPAFFFNNGYPVPGAQEAETFVRVLDRFREIAAV